MDLQTRKENNAIVVTLSGRLDAVTAPEFEKAVRELIEGGNHFIVLDFGPLDYISSAGLRGLLLMSKLLNAKGGRVCFADVQGNVRSVFDMCGFTALFKMENSVAEALAALG
ncbi:anti-anti-sigma factor [Methylomicrobium album BG8]|uniref:Anti-sigma factor antagonist n=2 Tax=Methylococcaceae TaxID=403 RepID=H8GKF5_METAL|nr:anti-anti-sigma factor [Methylomicrobium album BG8]